MQHQLEELSIEVTNQCKLACIHCSSGSTPQKLDNELTFEEHIGLIKDARELGATVLSLSGGDPLLCPHLVKLVDWAVDLGYDDILIYTTGHNNLGNCIWQWHGVHRVMSYPQVTWIFSLHSHKSEVNDMIMNVPGTLANILLSIQWLKKQGQKVEIHMVPMKPNYRDIPGIRDLCRQYNIDKLSLLRFVPQTRGLDNIVQLNMDKLDFITMQAIMANEMKKEGPEIRLGCPIDFRHALGLLPEKAKPCHAGDDLILVRPDGDAHPCAAWKSLPADVNVREYTLGYIWHKSEVFNYIRKFKEEEYKYVDGCESCNMVHSCKTGCLAQRLHAYGKSIEDLDCEWSDPLCPRGAQP